MHVLQISDVYFPRVNGVSTSIATFRRCLAEQDVACTLIVPGYADEASERGVVRVPARPVPRDPEDRLASVGAFVRAAEAQGGEAFDLIHVQTPFAAHLAGVRLARRWGLPLVVSYHTLFEEYLHHYVPLVPRALTAALARGVSRWQCGQADRIIAPSAAMRDRLLDYGIDRPIEVLPTGIPLAAYRDGNRARFRQAHGIAEDRPVALTVSRLAHEKNIDFLLDAADLARRTCPSLLLLVAGEGPAEGALRDRAAARGLDGHVRFLGYLERSRDLPDCYAAADLFVFASRTETQGLVLLEAMAAGTGVLALSSMGTASILAAGRGCLVGPDDVPAFAERMAACLSDRDGLQRLGVAARDGAAAWSDEAMARQLVGLYRALVDETSTLSSRRTHWKARTRGRPA
ncbi:MAG: glycosyltransferase [Rhodocyclaceae bacterium]|nr:glycosyltransferase [Rhodocyclaceae bacterium]